MKIIKYKLSKGKKRLCSRITNQKKYAKSKPKDNIMEILEKLGIHE